MELYLMGVHAGLKTLVGPGAAELGVWDLPTASRGCRSALSGVQM